MYVCMYVCMYIYIYICMCVHTKLCLHTYVCVLMHVCIYLSIYPSIYLYRFSVHRSPSPGLRGIPAPATAVFRRMVTHCHAQAKNPAQPHGTLRGGVKRVHQPSRRGRRGEGGSCVFFDMPVTFPPWASDFRLLERRDALHSLAYLAFDLEFASHRAKDPRTLTPRPDTLNPEASNST